MGPLPDLVTNVLQDHGHRLMYSMVCIKKIGLYFKTIMKSVHQAVLCGNWEVQRYHKDNKNLDNVDICAKCLLYVTFMPQITVFLLMQISPTVWLYFLDPSVFAIKY